jgi:hypothetical protein
MDDGRAARVRDLFDIPEHVRKTDFVVKLSEGVARADETASTYVVTSAIRDAIDGALGLVKTAIDTGRSHAAYIQGSFGSGKSHFMAIVSLLVDNSDAAWRVPQLHGLRDKHSWIKGKNVLQLRFHMVGQKSLEAAIFGEYVRWVRANRPEATIPPLFADDALFDDARRLFDQLGDEKFFGPMNPPASDPRWGKRAALGLWARERFDEASTSTDPAERAKLFDALARTHFTAFAQQRDQFVDIDGGLATLGRHAKSLGYDAVLLLLDELVLWLASGASNASWLHNEVQKAAKLVEAQNAAREIPIVSFIARQRDLADLVGDDLAGAENQRLRESLAWFKDRFERVELGDNNLPDIVSERILRAKNDAARKTLDDAFKALQAKAGSSWTTLLGSEDAAAFRKVYPFSPAVVETLVALSNSLQRNRTAIRLLMELLVEYIPDLTVGEVVPVGDLFDVLAGGDDTTDGIMRAHFEQSRQLYAYKLLPMIQETHGTTTAARCQRLRPEHRASLGCSGCAEAACRSDNRLVKTLLLAALAPAVRTLKGLTVGRLVQLNHGTLRAMIPGTEAMTAASRLRHYASTLGQLHVGTQADPSVDIDVAGVDLEPILQQSRDADTPGARQKIVRDILFENLGLDPSGDWGQDDKIDDWRGTVRKGHIRFTNVRRATPEMLRCVENHDWRLVIDYPFDDPGFGPNDDLAVVEKMREEGEGTWTLVMVPSFFSDAVNKLLGELAILDHILASKESKRVAVLHLRPEQQANAEMGLENLRTQKKARLHGALLEAYGLTRETEANIDPSRSIGQHFLALKPEVKIRIPLGGTLAAARTTCIPELLAERYPRHPNLRKLTKLVVERVLERFADLLERDGKPLELDKEDLEKARGTLGELGIVKTSEGSAHLVTEGKLQDLEQRRRQRNVDQPTVAEVRGWIDEGRKMGLQPEAQDLVVRAYAMWAARTFVLYGKPYTPASGAPIPDDAVLEKPELPTQSEWVKAIDLAGHTFGVTLPRRALNADNVKRFEVDLAAKLQKLAAGAAKAVPALERRLAERGVTGDVDRLVTARSGAALCALIEGKKGVAQVRALASFEPKTSAKAVGVALAASDAAVAALDDKLIFGAFARLSRGDPGAGTILEGVERALRLDEIHESLAPALRRQAEAANEWLTAVQPLPPLPPPDPPPPPGARLSDPLPPPPGTRVIRRDATKAKAREALAAVARELEDALNDSPVDVSVAIEVRITRKH